MKLRIITLILIVAFSNTTYVFGASNIKSVLSSVQPSTVYGTILKETYLYNTNSTSSQIIETLTRFVLVEIIEDRSQKWYFVKSLKSENSGWIQGEYLFINDEPETNTAKMTQQELEEYVEHMEFSSKTEYFVWTDISRQQTHIFVNQDGKWVLFKTFVCATGKNVTPSKRGTFVLSGQKGKWFFSERLGSGAMYWVQYDGTYLFHSVAMDDKQNIVDSILGERRSSGCIRLSVDDAKWFYENIPKNTTVFIN